MTPTAPPEVQRRLLDLQDLDTRLMQLRRQAGDHPLRAALHARQQTAHELETGGGALLGRLEDARAELARRESEVAVVDARRQRDETLLQQTASVKDVQGLESELAALGKRKAELEDLELGAMEEAEQAETALAEHTRALEQAQRAAADTKAELDAALADLVQQRDRAVEQRAAIAAELPADLLALYDRQRERYGFGASLLRRRVSTASGVELTGSDLAAVRAAAPDAVILCPDSQAILVRTEESGL